MAKKTNEILPTAPPNWRENLQWYAQWDDRSREAYAKSFCTHTLKYRGQTCVVISYPRSSGTAAVYDMDGGTIGWLDLEYILSLPEGRKTEEQDFQWDLIRGSALVDEAYDLWCKSSGN